MAPRDAARPSRRHHDSGTRRHKKRKSSHRKHASTSEEADSGRRSHSLSADALAQLNRDNARRSSHTRRVSELRPLREPERKPKRAHRDKEARGSPGDREERHRAKRKRRVVSGAILEEGRGSHGLRGGHGYSYDSLEKDDHYGWPEPKKNKRKRLCETRIRTCRAIRPTAALTNQLRDLHRDRRRNLGHRNRGRCGCGQPEEQIE